MPTSPLSYSASLSGITYPTIQGQSTVADGILSGQLKIGSKIKLYHGGLIVGNHTISDIGGSLVGLKPEGSSDIKLFDFSDRYLTYSSLGTTSKKAKKTTNKETKLTPQEKVTIDSVILQEERKKQILEAISQIEHTELIFEKWGFSDVFEKGTAISLLFYGVPGTGKTLMAQAIANEVKQDLKVIQSAEVQSSEPGQTERNIKAWFQDNKKKRVLLFDECDSLIAPRDEVGMILAAEINALLTALENYSGIVIFTTNRLGRMDPAFERRVSAKVEFPFPDQSAREQIWKRLIPKSAPLDKGVSFARLASYPIAGGNIKNAVLNAARSAAYERKKKIDEVCFMRAIEKEVESLAAFEAAFENQPKLPHLKGGGLGVSMGSGHKVEIEKVAEAR